MSAGNVHAAVRVDDDQVLIALYRIAPVRWGLAEPTRGGRTLEQIAREAGAGVAVMSP